MPNPRERRTTKAGPSHPRDLIAKGTAPTASPEDDTLDQPLAGDKKKRTKRQVQRFLELARDRFQQAQDAEKEQRERELADLRFYAGDQWPEDVKTARAGQNASNGLPPTPARPCLTFNKTKEPVRQVLNQERGAEMGIEIVPADDFGELAGPIDDTEIKLREGLVRRIQRESEARDARTWAFDRAVKAGRGFYAVSTRYVSGKTRDQDIYLRRLYNQACVTLDPAHEQPDGSDAEWGFIGSDLPWDQYRSEFPRAANGQPNAVLAAQDDEDFRAFGEDAPGWFRIDGKTRYCRVVEYFYTERTTRTLAMLESGEDVWEDELTSAQKQQPYETRDVVEKHIKWAKIDGHQILDETDWLGTFIPIVKVLGEEQQPYDSERRVEGMVRPMRDPGQAFNFVVTKAVETLALTPIPPIMLAEGQQEGYEAWYQAANTRTLPYLLYRTKDLEGNPVTQAPFTPPRDLGAIIGPLAAMQQSFSEILQSVSSIHDPGLGKFDHSAKSGKAILALQQQGQQGTSNYLDNLSRSIRYEGRIINDLLYPIYGGRPGRIARLVNQENQPETVLLHQPMIQQDGRPMPAPQGDPNAKTYTLTKDAQFNVIVKVTRSFDSRRDQEASTVGELLSNDPALMPILGDLFFENQDGPGHQAMADRIKAVLDPRVQQMLAQKDQGGSQVQAQQMQAQLQQLQGQLQQLQPLANDNMAKLQIEQMKQQAEDRRTAADHQFQIQLRQIDNAAKIEIARITAAKEAANVAQEAAEERLSTGLEQRHDVGMAAMQQSHEAQMAQHQAAVASQQTAQQQSAAAASQMQQQGHEAAMAQQAQQAQDQAPQAGA